MTPPPWYRQIWPWLLMLMPATALFGGLATFYLAATTNNALVVDDYYREGKAINQQLARDTKATQLGLTATLTRAADGRARIELVAAQGTGLLGEEPGRELFRVEKSVEQLLPGGGGEVSGD